MLHVLLLIAIIVATLLNSAYFYNSTAFAYYGFCITVSLFTIISIFALPEKKQSFFKLPVLLFGLWCLYVLLNYFTNRATLVFTIYSIVLYFLLLRAIVLFSTPNFKFKPFFIGIVGIAVIESVYCILQFLGICKSENRLIAVTGSWNNPNVTAIFLSLTVPIFLYLFKVKNKKAVVTGFSFLLIALLLLKCRAAYIGTVLSVIIFYALEYQFINWIKNNKNSITAKALFILALMIIIPLSSQLYNAKKASADGRKFIWKLSAQMIPEKPLIGYGYGFFEKEYNLYQADYIKNGKATAEELINAGPVIMPHNELLQNAVEGGIVGLLLISLFFGSILFAHRQKNENQTVLNSEPALPTQKSYFNLAYTGVVSFVVMSMVNSTIQIVPVMCLTIIYTAIVCSPLKNISLIKLSFLQNRKPFYIFSKIGILTISLYSSYLIFGMARADILNKKTKLLTEKGNYKEALQIMPALEPYLKENPNYWKNYGTIYFQNHSYNEALKCFEKAQSLSSLPDVYNGTGVSHEKLKQYPQAVLQYETLTALYPTKFLYKMWLLKAYLKNRETAKAIALANDIILLKPKIPSEKVNEYKKMCRTLISNLEKQNIN